MGVSSWSSEERAMSFFWREKSQADGSFVKKDRRENEHLP